MDDNSKNRRKFNAGFRKITKAEAAKLTGASAAHYQRIVKAQNVAAVPKDKPINSLLNNKIRLREFDSETLKPEA